MATFFNVGREIKAIFFYLLSSQVITIQSLIIDLNYSFIKFGAMAQLCNYLMTLESQIKPFSITRSASQVCIWYPFVDQFTNQLGSFTLEFV
eukprot:15868_1